MTPQEKFEEALTELTVQDGCDHLGSMKSCSECMKARLEAARSAHAACVEEARFEHLHGLEKLSVEDAYERGLREGAEREREECAKLLETETSEFGYEFDSKRAAAAIRALGENR